MIGGMGAAGNLALNDGGMAAERTGLAANFSLINGARQGWPEARARDKGGAARARGVGSCLARRRGGHPPSTHTHTHAPQGPAAELPRRTAGAHYNLTTQVPHPEAHVAEATFYKMLAAAGVKTIKLSCPLTCAALAPRATSASEGAAGAAAGSRDGVPMGAHGRGTRPGSGCSWARGDTRPPPHLSGAKRGREGHRVAALRRAVPLQVGDHGQGRRNGRLQDREHQHALRAAAHHRGTTRDKHEQRPWRQRRCRS